MDVKTALQDRRSIRGFLDKSVEKDTIKDVLRLAVRAVSGTNSQPWEFAVLTGDILKKISADNIDCLHSGVPEDNPYPALSGAYRERGRAIGKKLFESMSIARDDKEKRTWWTERGYRYFDAPVGIVLYLDRSLDTNMFRFDLGCVAQNICTAAMEYGLGTCVAIQPIAYERGVRHYLNIPDHKKIVIGIALGYPDWDFPANQVISQREDVDSLTAWYGFS